MGIYPNEAAVRRLFGALLLERHDEWVVQGRYMPLETMSPIGDAAPAGLPAAATRRTAQLPWDRCG